jgi:hypothetical protein
MRQTIQRRQDRGLMLLTEKWSDLQDAAGGCSGERDA